MARPPALLGNTRGAAAIEFALVAPVMALLLLGGFDTAHSLYVRAALQGIVQKIARDSALASGIESERQAALATLDNRVRDGVRAIANNATIDIKRRYYRTFSSAAAAQAEAWTDTNENGICDDGEPYQDDNNNNVWDPDGGNAGQGGAKDRTVYTVTMTYPRFFPLYKMIGGSNTTKISASTVLQNQPYGDQGSYGPSTVKNCP
ncbi:MAG: TadE/TadG family type IV pilus assembly protein [Pseudomonadota bacterium]